MNSIKVRISVALIALLLIISLPANGANKLIYLDNKGETLAQKWDSAISKAGSMGLKEYWVAWGFTRLMHKNNMITSCHSSSSRTFASILTGKDGENVMIDDDINIKDYTIRIKNDSKKKDKGPKVQRKVIVLFKLSDNGNLEKVMYGNEESSFCMDDQPVVWLGMIENQKSFDFLKKKYSSSQDIKQRKQIMSAIANHDLKKEIIPFLKDKYENETNIKIRETAVFWLGIQDDPDTIEYLEGIAYSDESHKVREEAVFAIYLGECDESINSLLKIAKSNGDQKVREIAIFWLGQKAEKKSLDLLGDIVENEGNVQLAKEAVFAISQHEGSNSIDKLFKIAKTHKSREVRKSAIFWLSQIDDDRVVDFLEEIIDAD
ncbi:MAG: HEAT repeat domain-containing protein [Acidobacteria bacterium]|nr:HEAT repeat domain-containing protein [Acidobacteriota bacterium]